MLTAVTIAAVLLGGLAIALFVRLQETRRQASVLAVERDALLARIADREADLSNLKETFEAMSARALKSSSEEFLKLAGAHLDTKRAQAAADLDQRRSAIDQLVGPLTEALKRAEEQIGHVARGNAGLTARMQDMLSANQDLRVETGRLTQALRKPNVRGRYGEIQLERVVELAGMRRWCDFGVQENLRDADNKLLKPDMVVRLPGGRVIAIDAKTSIDAYLDAVDENDPDRREALLDRYAGNVADQIAKLGRKDYWAQLEALEMVVMFVPGDQLVDAALERRPDLVEVAAEKNVVLASPSTLIGLLRAVHVGWRERELSDSAEELFRLGRELHERAAIALEHASRVGDAIRQTTRRYNEFVGSVDSRLVPTLKKFEERGARSGKTLGELRELDEGARTMQSLGEGDVIVPAAPKPRKGAAKPARKAKAAEAPTKALFGEDEASGDASSAKAETSNGDDVDEPAA